MSDTIATEPRTAFEDRVIDLLSSLGIPLNSVARDGVTLTPFGSAFILQWQGAAILTAEQAASLCHTPET